MEMSILVGTTYRKYSGYPGLMWMAASALSGQELCGSWKQCVWSSSPEYLLPPLAYLLPATDDSQHSGSFCRVFSTVRGSVVRDGAPTRHSKPLCGGDSFCMTSWPRCPDVWFMLILDVIKMNFGCFISFFSGWYSRLNCWTWCKHLFIVCSMDGPLPTRP